MMLPARVERGRWQRPVKTIWPDSLTDGATSISHTEYLDLDAVIERFCDATVERGDASLRDRLLYAINGDE